VMAVVGGTEPGHVMHVRQSTWQAPDWVITVLRINHGFMRARVPDLLLGMETIWRWRELPDVDLLGVVDRGAGPLGLACEDTNCWEWAELGGVAAADVVDGTGFVGMFVGGELSGLQERTREPLFWAASQPKPHGDVKLAVSGGDERLQAFFPLRTVHLPAPGFPLEAVSTAAEDLDGDGTLELLVELWGEGGWAAWLVPDAHDPGSTRSPVALGRIRAGAVWTAPGPTATGASAMLASSFSLNARALRATVLRAAGPRVGESAAAHVWAAEWDPASLLSGAAQVGPVRAGVAGHVDLPAAPCAAPSGTILSACRGAWVARGVAAAGETGAVHPDDAYTGGDHLLVVPGAGHTHVLVGRGLHPAAVADPAPVAAVGSQGDTWLGGDVGLHLRSASGSLGGVCHGAVQAADGPEGPLVVGQTGQDCATGGGRYTVWRGTEMSPLHIVGGDDGTPLTLLHEVPSEQGWPVLWRRGDGQAWGGWLDLGARPPAWADTPTPLGAPVDPGMLGLGRLRPAAVQVSALESPALALHTGWSEGAALPGEPGARVTALAVGDGSACGHAVAVLRGGELAILFEGVDPTCADLPLPQAALRLGDEEALVSLAADGSLWLSRLSGEFAVHRTIDPGMPAEAEPGPHARVEAGDLNGDGIDDLLLLGWRGTAPRVLLLDGHGGPLPAGAVHEQDVLLNVAGIARPGPSRPAPARAWDPALPLVQRRLVPLVGR
ncbi:MAG: hypothetical protein VX265_13035, partial [Myxococcota bacterium]|nr:hypothetical protein [Myxococcota bacterium]